METGAKARADEYREQIATALVLHPKVAFQGLVSDEAARRALANRLPDFVPFRRPVYHGFLPVVDWDHRIPSKELIVRVYCYYTPESLAYGKADLKAKLDDIQAKNVFPEFDVPDLSGVVADEAYDVVMTVDGDVQSTRLASAWRRDLDPRDAARAASVVRASQQFAVLKKNLKNRPPNLGDAEAVSWTPPCESHYERWTVDVWYLVSYDGMFGKGKSFLVDLETEQVVAVREFTVRPD